MIDMIELLPPGSIVPHMRAANKKQALQELARRAALATSGSERTIYEALSERERLGSTGIGAGVAIPHGKIPELAGLFGLFARIDRAIPFDAIDNEPVDLVFLLLAPPNAGTEHLTALARVS